MKHKFFWWVVGMLFDVLALLFLVVGVYPIARDGLVISIDSVETLISSFLASGLQWALIGVLFLVVSVLAYHEIFRGGVKGGGL